MPASQIISLLREYHQAVVGSSKAAQRRSELSPGSSRARVTTANAQWGRAAEGRDIAADRLFDGLQASQYHCPDCGSQDLTCGTRKLSDKRNVWWISCSVCHTEGSDAASISAALREYNSGSTS
ncbi:hypothetical protein LCGC14_0258980 [marine sediment metagenome]|uniref:Uncharacterized protein n=1 Tax=marine sediment metagenome TaxID=412755 RepID=A0A0F9X792_9ZZZZ